MSGIHLDARSLRQQFADSGNAARLIPDVATAVAGFLDEDEDLARCRGQCAEYDINITTRLQSRVQTSGGKGAQTFHQLPHGMDQRVGCVFQPCGVARRIAAQRFRQSASRQFGQRLTGKVGRRCGARTQRQKHDDP
ncbi:MAG: hypothetical protein PHY45_04240 [Rhodocyclaceae bacterium]|nr:hypothetical protein [Rhodocyclaceae bacterium]